ncbi:transcription factor BIM2-like [Cornus florida]|uniref:transcription factor BIM2-like n=1 Tax=Cornus florida TaxID=4283 RepID=UPI0028996578|nr:transcription factor BIM2-like [Cornus florida]
MVRSRKSLHQEDDEEFLSRTPGDSSHIEGKNADHKGNTHRSKHSETEQRRRSKINERFQNLRDLIPQNDQRRDKASFLLEVIRYIHLLQEKLNMYEGSYQGWSQESSKLMPWKNNCGPVESFLDQSEVIKNGYGNEDNIILTPSMLTNAQYPVESDLSSGVAYKATAHPLVTEAVPANMPLHPNLFGDVPTQPHPGSVADAELLAAQSQPQFWQARRCTTENVVPYTPNEPEELKIESGEASSSNAYSQGVLNTLTHALQSSGVDLSQASISVQLDIGKRANSGLSATMFCAKDHESPSPGNQARAHYGVGSSGEKSDKAHKRLRP